MSRYIHGVSCVVMSMTGGHVAAPEALAKAKPPSAKASETVHPGWAEFLDQDVGVGTGHLLASIPMLAVGGARLRRCKIWRQHHQLAIRPALRANERSVGPGLRFAF